MSKKIFKNIPEDYIVQECLANNLTSQTSAFNEMYKQGILTQEEYAKASLRNMSLDYICSAEALRQCKHNARKYVDGKLYSYNPRYDIPSAYLCRHCVELKLKEMIYCLSNKFIDGHDLSKLWKEIENINHPDINKIAPIIPMMEEIDSDGIKLRYGFDKKTCLPYDNKSYMYDIDKLVDNTEFFYDIAEKIINETLLKRSKNEVTTHE